MKSELMRTKVLLLSLLLVFPSAFGADAPAESAAVFDQNALPAPSESLPPSEDFQIFPLASVEHDLNATPQKSLQEVVKELREQLDPEGLHWTYRYNIKDRIRRGVRQANTSDSKLDQIPYAVVAGNTTGAVVGIHFAETFLLGPLFAKVGLAMGGWWGSALAAYGGLLTWPIPTGTPIDLLTESGCILVGMIVVIPTVQRNVYRVELVLWKGTELVARKLGGDRLYDRFFETRTGRQKILAALARASEHVRDLPSKDIGLQIHSESALADLHLGTLPNGDIFLERFTLHPESQTPEGSRILRAELKKLRLGMNITDAVLHPEMLVRAKQGDVFEHPNGTQEIRVKQAAVRLKTTSFHFKPCAQLLGKKSAFVRDHEL